MSQFTCPRISVELNKVQNSQFPLPCTDQAVVVKMVEPSFVNRIIPSDEGGGQTGPGARGDQRLVIRLVDGVSHPVVEVEDVPDGDVGSTPARSC